MKAVEAVVAGPIDVLAGQAFGIAAGDQTSSSFEIFSLGPNVEGYRNIEKYPDDYSRHIVRRRE